MDAGGSVPGWVRTIWVGIILVVPGGFLLFLTYAFGRAVLRVRRVAAQGAGGQTAADHLLAQVTFKDVLREVRASI